MIIQKFKEMNVKIFHETIVNSELGKPFLASSDSMAAIFSLKAK